MDNLHLMARLIQIKCDALTRALGLQFGASRPRPRLSPVAFFGLVVLLTLIMVTIGSTSAANQEPDELAKTPRVNIAISAMKKITHMNTDYFGLDMWGIYNDGSDPAFFYRSDEGWKNLGALGVSTLHYPTDRNNWAALYDLATAVPLDPPSKLDTPEFLTLNGHLGSEPMVAANVTILCTPGPGTPSNRNVSCQWATPDLAASWISFINNYSASNPGIPKVKYVLLGEEPYAGCDPLTAPGKINCLDNAGRHKVQLTSDQYAQRVIDWSKAIKKVDPSVQIGAAFQPNTNICSRKPCSMSWDETLLKKASSAFDFVFVHQYFVLTKPAGNELDGQRYSYYQRQSDIRVLFQGKTAMPVQIRKELMQWGTKKKKLPIFVTEFNAARIDNTTANAMFQTRQSLFAAFSVGELYLDLAKPVTVSGQKLPGASNIHLNDLYTSPVMIARLEPPGQQPQTVVLMPAWHALSMLKVFSGTDLLSVQVNRSPNTPARLPAIRAYAGISGNQLYVAIFNHSTAGPTLYDLNFTGFVPRSGTVTSLGEAATSFLTQNDLNHPNAIIPKLSDLDPALLGTSSIKGLSIPPHTFLLLALSQ